MKAKSEVLIPIPDPQEGFITVEEFIEQRTRGREAEVRVDPGTARKRPGEDP